MSKASVSKNPGKVRPGSNTSRPNGASAMAASSYPPDLVMAAMTGNRATRRLAMRGLRKARKAGLNP